jgi:hypothetical protein
MNFKKQIREGTGLDKYEINKLISAIKLDDNNHITIDELLEFCDEHLKDGPNIILELKYILAISNMEKCGSILKFLRKVFGDELTKDFSENKFKKILKNTLNIQESSCKLMSEEIKEFRPKIPNINIVDFYCLILNQRDENLLANKKEVNIENIKKKVMDFLNERFPKEGEESITMLIKSTGFGFNFSEGNYKEQIYLYDFVEIFVDVNQIITCEEAMILFDEINDGDEKVNNYSRLQIKLISIYKYFEGDGKVETITKKSYEVFEF